MKFQKVFSLAILIISWVFVIFLSAEIIVRLDERYRISGIAYDEKLGWRFIKNRHIKKARKQSGEIYRFSTNRHGFRDRDHNLSKGSNIKRIIFLGDSYTAGWHVSDEDVFVKLFEKMVNEKKDVKYDVMNMAISAWSTDQQLLCLKQEGVKYKPDYVFLMIAPNDIRESYVKKNKIICIPWQKRFLWRLSNHFCIYQFLQQKVFKTSYGSFNNIFCYFPVAWDIKGCPSVDDALFLKQMPPEVEEARYLFKAMLLEMDRLCIKNNCKLVLVVLPTKMEFDGTLNDNLYQPGSIGKYVESIAIEYDIAFLDLFQILKLEDEPLKIFIKDEYHFDRDGHIFVAAKLHDFFLRLK